MTQPRAVGSRASYGDVPAAVRAWVEESLGSAVVAASDQVGGFSPGCATRVVCADGTRAFVKAVGSELNPDSPTLFRREVLALTLLGSHPLWADLLASYDEGGWVALLLEDVEGHHPDLTDDAVMARLVADTDELGRVMQDRVPDPPRPAPQPGTTPLYRSGLAELDEVFRGWAAALGDAAAVPPDLMPTWVVDRAAEFADRLTEIAERPMTHLVHWDIRDDNLLRRPTGELVFLDWGACGIGPDWLDPLLARLERVDTPWFDASLTGSPALARAGDGTVDAWLVGMGSFLAYRAHTSEVVGLPTLNAFRRRESARFLDAAARRLARRP